MKRIIRDRHLTKEEAEKYDKIREQVKQDLPDLIKAHLERGLMLPSEDSKTHEPPKGGSKD